jgi:hypothetical protein
MSKSTKSHDRSPTNGKPNEATKSNLAHCNDEVDLLNAEQWVAFAERFRLSERELEVLILTSRAMPRKAIARALKIFSIPSIPTATDCTRRRTSWIAWAWYDGL